MSSPLVSSRGQNACHGLACMSRRKLVSFFFEEEEKERGGKEWGRFQISRAVTRTIAKDREKILSSGCNPFCGFPPFPLDNGPGRAEIEFVTSVNCTTLPHDSRTAIKNE